MNGLILYDNASPDYVQAGASSTVTGYNPENVALEQHHCIWKVDTYTGTPYVLLKFDPAETIKAWAVVANNFSDRVVSATLKVGTADNGGVFDLTVGTMFFNLLGFRDLTPTAADIPGTAYTKQWWKLEFSTATAQFQLGHLMLAREYFEFAEAPDAPFVMDELDQVSSEETGGGHGIRTKLGETYERFGAHWKSISDTEAGRFQTLWSTQRGSQHPVVYVPHLAEHSVTPYDAHYCELLRCDVSEGPPGGRFSADLVLEERP